MSPKFKNHIILEWIIEFFNAHINTIFSMEQVFRVERVRKGKIYARKVIIYPNVRIQIKYLIQNID